MPVTKLFIGSSAAARAQAKAVVQRFTSSTLKFLPWWEAFTAGNVLLGELDSIRNQVHGAVLLFSPDMRSKIRGHYVDAPNLNVLFEFGYFYGYFGEGKVSIMKYGEYYLPSDFGGYIHISGTKSFRSGQAVPVGKRTETEFNRWVAGL